MMDNIIILGTVVILIIGIIFAAIRAAKRRTERSEVVQEGTRFDAQIIGVAHPDTILNIVGQPNRTLNMLGVEWTDVTQAERAENYGQIRVKIKFTHPYTQTEHTVHHVLDRPDYKDDRLIKTGNPGTLTLGSASMAYLKHNKKLFNTYVENVKNRDISNDEKKQLIKDAMLMMNNQNLEWTTDDEGYNILNPPVMADGYELDGNLTFIQRTNSPVFTDWTKNLK